MSDALDAAVSAVHRRTGLGRAARGGAVGLGVGALVAVAAGPAVGLLPAVIGGLAGWWTRPDAAAAARRLDTALQAEGAVVCAHDRPAAHSPMAAALRQRVIARLQPGALAVAAPRPSPAWALLVAAWAWPLLQAPVVDGPGGVDGADGAGGRALVAGPASAASAASTAALAPDAGTRATAQTLRPDAGVGADAGGGQGAGEIAGREQAGGVGAQAGDRRALAVGARRIGLSPGTAAGIWLANAAGDTLPAAVERAVAPVRGRAPDDDDISDPARPFAPRYRPVIAAWFRRGGER